MPQINEDIADFLADRSRPLAKIIAMVGPPPPRKAIPTAKRFERLATAILHQQLAGAAAATITRRVAAALHDTWTAEALTALTSETLRSCGVSGAKAASLFDLAERCVNGDIELSRQGRLSDEVVLQELIATKGIGTWTAQMFLMGALGRADIWPTGDLGVRNGWATLHGLNPAPTPKVLEAMADHLRPFRSDVAWYCWRAIDLQRSGELPQ